MFKSEKIDSVAVADSSNAVRISSVERLGNSKGRESVDIDKHAVALAFSRAASGYDELAGFQASVGKGLIAALQQQRELENLSSKNACVLDLGAGTGLHTEQLRDLIKPQQLLALDIAPGMCNRILDRQVATPIMADFDHLPLQNNSVDLVFANLALQWSNDLNWVLNNIYRVLKPGGLLAMTTLLQGSMREIDQAWLAIDAEKHTLSFDTEADLQRKIAELFDLQVFNHRKMLDIHSNSAELIASVKSIGAGNHLQGRARKILSRSNYFRFMQELERASLLQTDEQVDTASSQYGLTYNVLQLVCKKKP